MERYCELADKTTQQVDKVATPCMDDPQFREEENESEGELSTVCSQVLTCLYLARIGRPDILCSVNKLARAVTKWTKAYDKRLARLISYIHHTSEYAAGAGRGEGVICTFPRIMRTLCRMWAFLVLLALDVVRTLLGVMSLNSRIRLWRLLRWTVWKP